MSQTHHLSHSKCLVSWHQIRKCLRRSYVLLTRAQVLLHHNQHAERFICWNFKIDVHLSWNFPPTGIIRGSWEAIFRVTNDWNSNNNTSHSNASSSSSSSSSACTTEVVFACTAESVFACTTEALSRFEYLREPESKWKSFPWKKCGCVQEDWDFAWFSHQDGDIRKNWLNQECVPSQFTWGFLLHQLNERGATNTLAPFQVMFAKGRGTNTNM